jgi:hypothetical protein
MNAVPAHIAEILNRGIDCCRRGDWNAGLRELGRLTEGGHTPDGLPGRFYSYLGYGLALVDRKVRDGLKLCRHSIKVGLYEPENYVNLARTYLLARDRSGAVRAVRDGLRIDPNNGALRQLRRELGVRKSPVLSFLSRNNPLNVALGRLRHMMKK